MSRIHMHHATPIFRVRDLDASLRHYVQVLGFREDWKADGIIGSVSRDDATIMLCEGDQGHPGTWAWIGVGDAEALCAELTSRGAKIRQSPTNYPWAYEMQVEDLDGNVLRLGSETRKGEPFGPWLDMDGKLWPLQS